MNANLERRPHASLQLSSRQKKALKIEKIISSVTRFEDSSCLEIGTGSGVIANHVSSLVGSFGTVAAVDVLDQRVVKDGYDFALVEGTKLPHESDKFDICISNHVLEHVGDFRAQAEHLEEICRVLKPNGWLYLAIPNKWSLMEPHFRLPLLSWLPRSLSDKYVRLTNKGNHYDCLPPSLPRIKALLLDAGFNARDVSNEGIRLVGALEKNPGILQTIFTHPKIWSRFFYRFLPSYIFLAQPEPGNHLPPETR